jgi:hypothetical protein
MEMVLFGYRFSCSLQSASELSNLKEKEIVGNPYE